MTAGHSSSSSQFITQMQPLGLYGIVTFFRAPSLGLRQAICMAHQNRTYNLTAGPETRNNRGVKAKPT